MGNDMVSTFRDKKLSEKDFTRLSQFIQSEYGIKLPPAKKIMLESRLQKRLRKLEFEGFSEYIDYIFSPQGQYDELINMLDVVTTNKTDFFREPAHFDYLVQTTIPELILRCQAGVRTILKVWSAGCSSGEEAYTLAIVLNEFCKRQQSVRFSILATDLSSAVLKKGKLGIYEEQKVAPIPHVLREKYLLRSIDRSRHLVRIAPALRRQVRFTRLNLMEDYYTINDQMDIIFCRNVIIYFSQETQEKIINQLCRHIRPGGYIFMGHSETLFSMNVPLKQVEPTIYRKL